jgi:lysozyme
MIPSSKPRAPKHVVVSEAIELWRDLMADPFPDFYVLGVRGYYRDTMGKAGENDRSIYDDAIFVVGPECFVSFNANTDPSAFRKGIATLATGWHPYRPGLHGISRPGVAYPAFRPATRGEALPVYRDGESGISKTPGIAINIHRGGINTTSSEGCQTIHPSQWAAFHALVTMELKKSGQKTFYYGLMSGPIV